MYILAVVIRHNLLSLNNPVRLFWNKRRKFLAYMYVYKLFKNVLPSNLGLNETLQLWMNCRATRTLIDITTQCLHCLINSDTETCISALLGKKNEPVTKQENNHFFFCRYFSETFTKF